MDRQNGAERAGNTRHAAEITDHRQVQYRVDAVEGHRRRIGRCERDRDAAPRRRRALE